MQESDLGDVRVLQALNSIVSSGELPTLFTNDELEGLLQVILLRVHDEIMSCIPTTYTYPTHLSDQNNVFTSILVYLL